jgi:hypothetical protein
VQIKVKYDIANYFQTRKGLRQDDSLFPILFNILADMLAILFARGGKGGCPNSCLILLKVIYPFYNMLMTRFYFHGARNKELDVINSVGRASCFHMEIDLF